MAKVRIERGEPSRFRVGKPAVPPKHFEPDCKPFSSVTHTTHVLNAIDVLRKGKIQSSLVYDESHLNTERITVVWVSPNCWQSYRYGNVQFVFDWSELIDGKHAYWIEVARYKPPAARILLTTQDRNSIGTPYDPTDPNGPWWQDGDKHFFKGDICLEFMIEDELLAPFASEVAFVEHHASFCCVKPTSPSSCRELGASPYEGAARFLSRAVAENLSLARVKFDSSLLALKCDDLLSRLGKRFLPGGSVRAADPGAGAIARAVFGAYANYRHDDDLRHLISLFASADEAREACLGVLATTLGRTTPEITAI